MDAGGLSQAFANMDAKQTSAETYMVDIAKVVGYNGQLLNALVSRVNTIEAKQWTHSKQVDQLEEDVKGALTTVDSNEVARDKQLRQELDAMMSKL